MSDKQTLAEIPVRIVSRYIQNFKFFIHGVFSLFGEDKSLTATKKGDSNAPDKFGFKKSLILLTNPGKVVAMSSQGGGILWTYFDP
jgi:hypothetical protein